MVAQHLLLLAPAVAALANIDPNLPWSVCAANQNEPFPSETLAEPIQAVLDTYIETLNTCNTERFALLKTEDYFAYDGRSVVTNKAERVADFDAFCARPLFNVRKFTVESAVQMAWNIVYLRIKLSNPNFKTCNADLHNAVVSPVSLTFTPCWASYKIKTEIYGVSGDQLFPLLTNDCTPQ